MKTQLIVLAALMTGACATPYEKCMTLRDNPYDVDLNDMHATKEHLKQLKADKFPKMGDKEFVEMVFSQTHAEWQRYGSVDACIATENYINQRAIQNVEVGYNLGKEAVRNNPEEDRIVNEMVNQKYYMPQNVQAPNNVNVYFHK